MNSEIKFIPLHGEHPRQKGKITWPVTAVVCAAVFVAAACIFVLLSRRDDIISVDEVEEISVVSKFQPSLLPPGLDHDLTTHHAHMTAANEEIAQGLKRAPHGGVLVNRMAVNCYVAEDMLEQTDDVVELNERQLCDVEQLINGGFSPLTGFMDEAIYESVLEDMRLPGGLIWGLPVVLDTSDESHIVGSKLLLKYKNQAIAVMTVTSRFQPNKAHECSQCYSTTSVEHPGCLMVSERGRYYIGGPLVGVQKPKRDVPCNGPAEVRAMLPANTDVVAFQCRNPIHRAHYELFMRALDAPNVSPSAIVLIHPTIGPTQDDDIPGYLRYRTYEVLKEEVSNERILFQYLPYSMHMAGPREAIQHMIIRKNYGCTHFIIGRDMAGSKSSLTSVDFYEPYDAQELAQSLSSELGVAVVPSLNLVFTQEKGYVTADHAKSEGLTVHKLSGTRFRAMLRNGDDIPEWFAFKSVVKVLREGTQQN